MQNGETEPARGSPKLYIGTASGEMKDFTSRTACTPSDEVFGLEEDFQAHTYRKLRFLFFILTLRTSPMASRLVTMEEPP